MPRTSEGETQLYVDDVLELFAWLPQFPQRCAQFWVRVIEPYLFSWVLVQ
jgi:hypothetical protein